LALKILVMGLPGAGKTTFATALKEKLQDKAVHLNADAIRKEYDDWDFSTQGRMRQAGRMQTLAAKAMEEGKHAIADFVCPTKKTRESFKADVLIWVDTIKEGRFEDTNKLFEAPNNADIRIDSYETEKWLEIVCDYLNKKDNKSKMTIDWKKPTAMMLGRYQPFHDGHKELFKQILERTGQVAIMVRDVGGNDEKNPFGFDDVKPRIEEALKEFEGSFEIVRVPNITTICYGRDVGYSIEKIKLPEHIEDISATKIRAKLFDKAKEEVDVIMPNPQANPA
jgi:adenylylsulfate kinase